MDDVGRDEGDTEPEAVLVLGAAQLDHGLGHLVEIRGAELVRVGRVRQHNLDGLQITLVAEELERRVEGVELGEGTVSAEDVLEDDVLQVAVDKRRGKERQKDSEVRKRGGEGVAVCGLDASEMKRVRTISLEDLRAAAVGQAWIS